MIAYLYFYIDKFFVYPTVGDTVVTICITKAWTKAKSTNNCILGLVRYVNYNALFTCNDTIFSNNI